jgi:hypothetical protein
MAFVILHENGTFLSRRTGSLPEWSPLAKFAAQFSPETGIKELRKHSVAGVQCSLVACSAHGKYEEEHTRNLPIFVATRATA